MLIQVTIWNLENLTLRERSQMRKAAWMIEFSGNVQNRQVTQTERPSAAADEGLIHHFFLRKWE